MAEPLNPNHTDVGEKVPAEVAAKLEAIRKAAAHCDAPTGDIRDMLAEIELGFTSSMKIENE